MDTKSTLSRSINALTVESPDDFVIALEAFTVNGPTASPRRLRTEEARSIVDLIVKTETLGKEHLERIRNVAMRSSEYCWDQDEDAGLHSIEYRRLARLYESIAEIAERKLSFLRD